MSAIFCKLEEKKNMLEQGEESKLNLECPKIRRKKNCCYRQTTKAGTQGGV